MKTSVRSKKRFILFCFVGCLAFGRAQAQWVNIPDSAFRDYIATYIDSSAISGTMMDTTNAVIISMKKLDVSSWPYSITDLTGVQYFDNLTTLYCGFNSLTTLPALPPLLDMLDCSYGLLTNIPSLPPNLRYLYCGQNQLTSLPPLPASLLNLSCWDNPLTSITSLPASLQHLWCQGTNLTSLPSVLPSSLLTFECYGNSLTTLPPLPPGLTFLNCYENSLTSLPALPTGLTVLNCYENNLTSLPFLHSGLTEINCHSNSLITLPSLPSSLTWLDCSTNNLTALPPLPAGLDLLGCGENNLTTLPSLPASLKLLSCGGNNLTSLPVLPASLISLGCGENKLTSLPVLPSSLQYIECQTNELTSLPSLPSTLKSLHCSGNKLTGLPALPNSIEGLYIYDNAITSLPTLPANLLFLDCSQNALQSIPALPEWAMWNFYCAGNQLTVLPKLPKILYHLNCQDNDIDCMPFLPDDLQLFQGEGNNFTCIPNLPPYLTSSYDSWYICDAFNTSCSLYPHVTGSTYRDDNLNGQRDPGEERHKGLTLYMQPGNNIFSDNDSGYFDFTVDTGLAFTITHSSLPYYNIIPGTHTTPALGFDMVDSLNDFILQRIGLIHDLTIIATGTTAARVGMDNYIQVHAGNKGTVTDTASVRFVIDSNLTYIAAAPPPSSVSGDTLQWDNVILEPGGLADFEITVHLDNLIPLGTDLFSVASISPVANDTVPADNVYTSEQEAVGSFDPNDKAVTPEGDLPQAAFENGQWLDYTIRFQNTGNAEAFIVEIKDTLSSNIYTNTLQVIAASHDMVWNVRSKLATFTFKDINLADSTSNEPASHGFVRYKVKADTSLLPGAAITNTAYIYFDANPPVQTNTVTTMVKFPAGLKTTTVPSLALFPNPVHDKLHIQNSAKGECIVYSTIGQEVLRTNATAQTIIDVSGLANGVYFLQLKTETGSVMGKFVKD